MTGRKDAVILIGFVLAASLIASSVTAAFLTHFHNRTNFQTLGQFCSKMIKEQPELEQPILSAVKKHRNSPAGLTDENILSAYGYRSSDFVQISHKSTVFFAAVGFAAGSVLFVFAFCYRRKRETMRISALINNLEKVNTGTPGLVSEPGEDEFSKLQDEIYKTVTMLYQTREAAVETRNNFADNLSNIAHQLKTPITAISLSTQMMKYQTAEDYPEQVGKQLKRLVHLEEALLLLSKIDAGTLFLQMEPVDVFTVLTLAADNLQEIISAEDVYVDIPEIGEIDITADLDWTMEAVMNLLRNCIEYTPSGGTVHCSYSQNPLYTEIVIWDEGKGFEKADIPHLFERFYCGKNAKKSGIGIGLSLAKGIVERQNGTIWAKNLPDGGGCFEIRFYSH